MKGACQPEAAELLRTSGMRRTQPRLAVLGALLEAGRPVAQEEIAEQLGRKAPNRVTIYRALEVLCQAGLVHRAFLHDRTWHFEPAHHCTEHQCHPHFTCSDCGRTTCLLGLRVPQIGPSHSGYAIRRQRIQLEGLCPACNQGRK